jgi:hypothetical protein
MDHVETKELMFSGDVLGRDEKVDAELCEAVAKLGITEQLRRCCAARSMGARPGNKRCKTGVPTWRQSNDVLNAQTSNRADLTSMSFSRLQELSADSVVWTENCYLRVGIDAVGGNSNMTCTGELSFE